ncbi:MAG: putative oxidoreductase [Bryobacterales bacterium]|nr:putative oxidoreductase [Bryobacterales bacterium]
MEWSPNPDALRGRLAVVAGATRGAGRGIAAALGEAGATVVCAGRSTRSSRSEYNRTETIEETAELVTRLGGTGISAAVDHLESDQVKDLAERIRKDHGRIDVLVNDIWGAELLKGGPSEWNRPIWEHDLDKGLRILRLAIDTHLITSHHLLPLLVEKPGGVLIEVTDGTADYNASHYRLSVFYDLAKVAVNRMAFSQGHELEPYGAIAVAVTPGWLRSEMRLENFGVSEENWRDALRPASDDRTAAPPDFSLSESPHMSGVPWLPWQQIPRGADGIRDRSAPVNSHQNMGSRTLTDRNPTSGGISRRSASVDWKQTSMTIGDLRSECDLIPASADRELDSRWRNGRPPVPPLTAR